MVILRDYQLQAVETIWARLFKSRSVLCVASTGSGKTEIMIEVIRKSLELKPDLKFCILVQKIQLIEQTIRRFKKVIPSVTAYCGTINEFDLSGSVVIATIQSIYDVKIDGLNCIIIDECHNSDADGGRYQKFIEINDHEKLKFLGFTATPFRADGPIYGEDKLFKEIDFKIGLSELIAQGHLVPPSLKAPEHQFDVSTLRTRLGEYRQEDVEKLTGDLAKIDLQVKDALSRIKDRKKIVWNCSSIDHCESVYSKLKELGEEAVRIHSKANDRIDQMWNFEKRDCRHLVFVTIVSEGYDYPPIDCVVLMRPTKSPVLYVQTVGRGLRLSEGKTNCLVLDYGRVVENLGALDNPKIQEKRGGKKEEPTFKVCKECFEYVPTHLKSCQICGFIFESEKRDSVKNLTNKPSDIGEILEQKNFNLEIRDVALFKHKSKAGNDCLKIRYYPENYLQQPVDEFFASGNDWAYKRMQKRLLDLNVEFASTLEEQVTKEVNKIPLAIFCAKDGKYTKILQLIFTERVLNELP